MVKTAVSKKAAAAGSAKTVKAASTASAGKTPAVKTAAAKKAVLAAPATVKKAKTPQAKPAVETKEKPKKIKLVRDSFTMPEAEYAVLGEVKKTCLKAGIEVKKSQLLRIGVALIRKLDTAQLKEILASLPALKAGRPKKGK